MITMILRKARIIPIRLTGVVVMNKKWLVGLAACVMYSSYAYSEILLDTGPPHLGVNDLYFVSGGLEESGNFRYAAARFELQNNAVVQAISAYVSSFISPSGKITFEFTQDDGSGVPNSDAILYEMTQTFGAGNAGLISVPGQNANLRQGPIG